jgi:hypothetical protein
MLLFAFSMVNVTNADELQLMAQGATSPPKSGLQKTQKRSSSIKLTASDTARSTRGLSDETLAYAQSTGTPQMYQEALDRALANTPSSGAVEQFLREGSVGRYGR